MMKRSHYERLLSIVDHNLLQIFDQANARNFEEFVEIPAMRIMVGDENNPQFASMNSTLQLLFHLYSMRKHGEKIFVLEPDITLMLSNTDIKGVIGNQLRTPYQEQLFVLPENQTLLELYNPDTGYHRLSEIYVSYLDGELRLMAVGAANGNSIDEHDDTFAYFRFVITGDQDLKAQITAQIDHHSKDSLLVLSGGVHNLDKAAYLFNFILNTLLYVCSPDAETYYEGWADVDRKISKLSGKAKKAAISKLKARHHFLKIRLGANVKLTAEQRQYYASGSTSKRTLVMGHWMHYHIGVGRTEIVLKWRQPFWRGVGELSNVPHLL